MIEVVFTNGYPDAEATRAALWRRRVEVQEQLRAHIPFRHDGSGRLWQEKTELDNEIEAMQRP